MARNSSKNYYYEKSFIGKTPTLQNTLPQNKYNLLKFSFFLLYLDKLKTRFPMKQKLLRINQREDKLNSRVGRTLTYKQLVEFASKLPNKIKSLV